MRVFREGSGKATAVVTRQMRHTVAKWLFGRSVSRRLSATVAAIVAVVIVGVALLQTRSFERAVDRDLVDAARLGAQSVADNLGARDEPPDAVDVREMLNDLVETDPLIDEISVIELDRGDGTPRVFTSTATEEDAALVDLAGRVLRTRAPAEARSPLEYSFVQPVARHPRYAVAVTVGLKTLVQARKYSLAIAFAFAVPAIALVAVLVSLAVRRILGRPLDIILRTMARTSKGDLSARAHVPGDDELGAIAAGLNEMLAQLAGFTDSLHTRIEDATREVSLRNAQLTASHEQLLATQQALARAERVAALGQVAATVAHQAGTPLNLVSGYVQMILDDSRVDERTRARLQTVDRQIQHVSRVLRAMLDRARPPLGAAPVPVGELIARVREIAEPRLSRIGIVFDTRVEPGLPMISADATQLEMALLNLVTNAIDAMPNGGALSVRASGGDGTVRLEIADSGPGLPSGVLEHVFDPWVTTKPAGHGSGLGLAIVRDVVRSHGGSIQASNGRAGAVFLIELPAPAASLAV